MQILNQELLEYFREYLLARKSSKTAANICRDVKDLLEYLNDKEINSGNLEEYIDYLEANYAHASFITKVSGLRRFINWLDIPNNPFWTHKYSAQKQHEYYEVQNLELNSLLPYLIYHLFLDIEELINLNMSSFNQASRTIISGTRTIKLDDEVAAKIKEYLRTERQSLIGFDAAIVADDPLLLNPKSASRYKITEVLEELHSLNLKITLLKRSRIIHLLQDSLSPESIFQKLGVRISDFYQAYIKKPEYRLLSAYNKFHPRA